jgi:2',3'-cyclic-nucleotide 2'-phosphodiesterase (5'-nucleotidase family)
MKRLLLLALIVSFELSAAPAALKHITLLTTNDIHGGVEPTLEKGKPVGGIALWASVVSAIRQGLHRNEPYDSGVLLVDAGDQFQGTLISNYNEGQLVFDAMDRIGYDAVVPGNHDYDFGPLGWLVDQSGDSSRRREVIERLAARVKFPLLSSNTFFKDSLRDVRSQRSEDVDTNGCRPKQAGLPIDWDSAKQPEFLKPYVIKDVAGARVALIGLDHPATAGMTTKDNVADLCFADEIELYRHTREALRDRADIFVLIVHDGDAGKDKRGTKLVEAIQKDPKLGVDAVVSGHTHYTYTSKVGQVPLIQSGSGGTKFGRIDLYWNPQTKRLDKRRTKSRAGLRLLPDGCDEKAEFCTVGDDGKPRYEGVPLAPVPEVEARLAEARAQVRPLATRKIGQTDATLTRDRIAESPLSDVMTDALRELADAEISFVNTGGIREDIAKGEVTYEQLYRVMPFNNHAVLVGPMPGSAVLEVLERSVQTCGAWGAYMQSGLRVTYERHCDKASGAVDESARVLRVETVSGELVYDAEEGIEPQRDFRVATIDFLYAGGEGLEGFKGVPLIRDLGIYRELMAERYFAKPAHWLGGIDGRWRQVNR